MSTYMSALSLVGCLVLALAASGTAAVPEMQVGRSDAAPLKIDGHPDEPAWKSAGCVPLFVDWVTGRPVDVQTTVRLMWDAKYLTVAFDCEEPDVASLVVDRTERDAELWHNDSIELFIQPPAQAPQYYHFIISASGVLHDARVYDSAYDADVEVQAARLDDRWVAEVQIPWRQIGGAPREAMIWRMNFTRTRKVAAQRFDDGLSCWSVSGGPFHNVDTFGKVVFVDSAPNVDRLDLGRIQAGANKVHLSGQAEGQATAIDIYLGGLGHGDHERVSSADGRWHYRSACTLTEQEADGLLTLSLAAQGLVFYRQDFPLEPAPLAPLSRINPALDRLRLLRQPGPMPQWVLDEAERILSDAQEVTRYAQEYMQGLSDRGAQFSAADDQWREIAQRIRGLQERINHPVLWSHDPLEQMTPTTMPDSTGKLEIEIETVINEYESAAVLITNVFSDEPLHLRAAMTPLSPPGHTGPMGYGKDSYWTDHLQLSEAVMIRTLKRGVIADPVAQLDGAGRVTVPVGRTVELWLTVNTRGMKAGCYQGEITLKGMDPANRIPALSIPVKLRVWPVTIPDQTDFLIGAWDYNKGGLYQSALHDLLEHRINFLHVAPSHVLAGRVPCMPGPDGEYAFDLMDPLIERVKGHGKIFIDACWCGFVQSKNHWEPWHDGMIHELVRYLEEKGFGYDDWYLHISDENITDEFLEMARQLKEADANVQLIADPMSVQMTQIEQLKRFAQYIDLWIPHHASLDMPGMEVLRLSGRPILTYHCDPGRATTPELNRMLPVKAWAYELDGVALWSYMEGYEDLWNDLDGPQHDWAKAYFGPTGRITPSKRWHAYREGLEDVLLLTLLAEELKERGLNPADAAVIKEARRLGKSGLKGLTAIEAITTRAVQQIITLRGEHPTGRNLDVKGPI